MSLRVVSYGGGVQSNALLVLAVQGKVDFDTFLFANVGDDSEHPKTLEYVHDVAMPYAKANGIELVELQKKLRDGSVETLVGRMTKPGSRSIGIPVRMSNGAPGNRQCTADFKIRVVAKWLKQQGASEDDPAVVAIGFSTDEIIRVKGYDPRYPTQRTTHPLIDLGISRQDCAKIIVGAGLPMPPKSACYFCPFHSLHEWERMARQEPDLFEKAVALEEHANEIRSRIGKDPVYFTRKGAEQKLMLPLLIGRRVDQELLFDDEAETDGCDSGSCWT